MPIFTPYFSLDSSTYRVGNGGRLRCCMGAAGIGIYVMLLSHLRDCPDCRAPLDYDLLAFDLHEDAAAVRRVVEEFGLFDIDRSSGTFTSPALDSVRALGWSSSPSSGRATTRTGRVRRVRTAAQAYRRSVRRLAADNALPPDADDQAGEEGDDFPAENDFPPAEEEEKTNPADALPTENESAPAASENARSPRTEEKRGEQNKIPHTPIVPFPPSGKGTRASHAVAPVVGEEEGASEAEVETAVPTLAVTPIAPAEKEPETTPADSPTAEIESAHPDTRTPQGETNTTQTTTSTDAPDPRTPRGKTSTTQAKTSATHPNTDTPHGESSTEQAKTSADAPNTRKPRGKTSPTQGKTSATHPNTDTTHGKTSTAQATTSADDPDTRTPHGETDTTPTTTSADAPDMSTPRGETDTTQTALNTETANPAPLDPESTDDARGTDNEDGGAFVPPTANEVRRFAQALHHPEFDAEWFVHYYAARHWQRHNGHPVRSWQTMARYWLTHPLQVAQHLLRHRPDPGAAPADTSASPAGVVATAGSANPSSPGIGAAPAGTRTSSPASGVPLGGSLSLPAPTPLQQSRLCDLRHMVLQLFADTPAAAPAAASTVPDAPTAVSTPVPSMPTSAPTPRVLSPAKAAHFIEAQTLSAADAEEENRACEISTADGEKNTDAQAFPTAHSEEEAPACKISTADTEEDELHCDKLDPDGKENIDAQAFPTDPAEEENRAHEIFTPNNEKDELNGDELPTDAKESIDTQAFPTDPTEEENRAHEISTTDIEENTDAQALPTARSEEENRACEISTTNGEESTDAQAISTTKETFGTRSPHGPDPPTGDEPTATAARHSAASHSTEKHPFTLSLNHDAPPLLPLHPPAPVGLGCTLRVQSAQPPFGRALLGRIDIGRAPCPAGSRPLRPQPAENRRGHPEDRRATPDHVPLGSTHEPKTDDFIDNSVAHEPQHRPTAGKHPANEPEHPTDEFDAGQRLLDTAAHRRAVRAELAECCGALRHLAHCCVAF